MKDRLIILIIAIIFIIGAHIVLAAPTYKNCGTTAPQQDGACSDAACRSDMGNFAITNCEVDFATNQTNGWNSFCDWSDQQQVGLIMNPNGNSFNLYPIGNITSLANLHIYTICKTQTSQDR